jgi:hypothetical protein
MTPTEILSIRESLATIQGQSSRLSKSGQVAMQIAAAQLAASIAPYCWGCGELLAAWDCGDHLCNGCIGGLPVDYPI